MCWGSERSKENSVFSWLSFLVQYLPLFLWHKHSFQYTLLKIYNKYCTSNPVYAMTMHFFYKQCQHENRAPKRDWAPNFTLLKDTGNKFAICCGRCWTEQPRDGAGAGEDVLPRENPPHRQVQYPSSATQLKAVLMIIFLHYFKRRCALRELDKMQGFRSESVLDPDSNRSMDPDPFSESVSVFGIRIQEGKNDPQK